MSADRGVTPERMLEIYHETIANSSREELLEKVQTLDAKVREQWKEILSLRGEGNSLRSELSLRIDQLKHTKRSQKIKPERVKKIDITLRIVEGNGGAKPPKRKPRRR